MHSVNVHIDETMNQGMVDSLRQQLLSDPYIRNVEMRTEMPHDMLVEFDAHHNVPMHVLSMLQGQGFHADIVGC